MAESSAMKRGSRRKCVKGAAGGAALLPAAQAAMAQGEIQVMSVPEDGLGGAEVALAAEKLEGRWDDRWMAVPLERDLDV